MILWVVSYIGYTSYDKTANVTRADLNPFLYYVEDKHHNIHCPRLHLQACPEGNALFDIKLFRMVKNK